MESLWKIYNGFEKSCSHCHKAASPLLGSQHYSCELGDTNAGSSTQPCYEHDRLNCKLVFKGDSKNVTRLDA